MNLILLSGGSGKRLWPLSNDIRSKQFLKIFKNEDGLCESMVQRMFRQIKAVDPAARITIATSKAQVSTLTDQLGDELSISVEPCRRDTFPAIALATAYLHDVQHIPEDEAVVVCPVDPYAERGYYEALRELYRLVKGGRSNLMLMGISPTYPSEKYGYIIPETKESVSRVLTFREKPDRAAVEQYISQGALWNGGVFAYRLRYVLDIAKRAFGTADYHELFSDYDSLTKISFDYAVAEKESEIEVLRYTGDWKDLGTWNTLSEAMQENTAGDKILCTECENVHVINELNIPLLCIGIKDAVVSASPNGILVSDKELSGGIKPLVDRIQQESRSAESWGEYRVLDISEKSMTLKLTIYPNRQMSFHSHSLRDEVWTVISGTGRAVVDGVEKSVKPTDIISIPAGCRHTIISGSSNLELIEIRVGEISVHDKEKFE